MLAILIIIYFSKTYIVLRQRSNLLSTFHPYYVATRSRKIEIKYMQIFKNERRDSDVLWACCIRPTTVINQPTTIFHPIRSGDFQFQLFPFFVLFTHANANYTNLLTKTLLNIFSVIGWRYLKSIHCFTMEDTQV